MELPACYRVLELDPAASDEELKRAYRDLTKVWHPDRFGDDPVLRRKAEEKLKVINHAFATIQESRRAFRVDDAASGDDAHARVATDEARRRSRRLTYAVACAAIAAFILLRRPTPAGLVIAVILFFVSAMLLLRTR